MRFVKMHGIGNDYVYLDAFSDPGIERRGDLDALARRMSDRHTGIGSDGIILVCRPRDGGAADVRMRMFNADGSESEMCGNGVRCVAKFAHDRLGVRAKPMRVETGRGVMSIDYTADGGKLGQATVDMGEPILDLQKIPVNPEGLAWSRSPHHGLELGPGKDGAWVAAFASMGNPHAVMFEPENELIQRTGLKDLDVARIGPLFEHHRAFSRRINAHFVAVHSHEEATMRTWERGAGITMACGTGACAVLVAGVLTGRLGRRALLHLPGGDLNIRWDEQSNRVFMTGPATDVFVGEWPE
jgi:diaminopimelate epimerase